MPTSENSRVPESAFTRTVSPIANFPASAVVRSSITSFGPIGRRPVSVFHKPATLEEAMPPKVGGPWSSPSGLPSLPITRA